MSIALRLALLPLLALAAEAQTTSRVDISTATWTDAVRNRDLPVKIYRPLDATGACPVILFSHGLGGTRDASAFLGSDWAAHGYLCVFMQHPGSDDSVWRGKATPMAAMKTAANAEQAVARAADEHFVLDRLIELGRTAGPLKNLVDTNCIGIAGHSFGANTSLAAVGQGGLFRDPRIKAAIAYSPPVPAIVSARTYRDIHVPVMHWTGTLDVSPIGRETGPKDRRIPFDRIAAGDQYLLILNGGDHMTFADTRRRGNGSKDVAFHELLKTASLAFWDAYIRGDTKALVWLKGDGLKQRAGSLSSVETK